MDFKEIATYIKNNISTFISPVNMVVGSLITTIFLRSDTATQEFEKIKAQKFDEVVDDLLKNGKLSYVDYYKAKNFLKIAEIADQNYKEMAEESTEQEFKFDFEWFIRFYEAVGDICNEDLQKIWAKIMTGEVLHPGKHSLRLIKVFREVSYDELVLFDGICKYVLYAEDETNKMTDYFLLLEDDFCEYTNCSFSERLRLIDAGLLSYNLAINISYKIKPYETKEFYSGGKTVIEVKNDTNEDVVISKNTMFLSETGRELYELIYKGQDVDNLNDYFKKCESYLLDTESNVNIFDV